MELLIYIVLWCQLASVVLIMVLRRNIARDERDYNELYEKYRVLRQREQELQKEKSEWDKKYNFALAEITRLRWKLMEFGAKDNTREGVLGKLGSAICEFGKDIERSLFGGRK